MLIEEEVAALIALHGELTIRIEPPLGNFLLRSFGIIRAETCRDRCRQRRVILRKRRTQPQIGAQQGQRHSEQFGIGLHLCREAIALLDRRSEVIIG